MLSEEWRYTLKFYFRKDCLVAVWRVACRATCAEAEDLEKFSSSRQPRRLSLVYGGGRVEMSEI